MVLHHSRLEDERSPHFAGAIRKLELLRHHADHLEGLIVEQEAFADYVRVASETCFPETPPEYDDLGETEFVFTLLKTASNLRLNSEGVEEGGGDFIARIAF